MENIRTAHRDLITVTALLAGFVVCLAIVMVAGRMWRARLQAEARAEVERRGGHFEWDYVYQYEKDHELGNGSPPLIHQPNALQSGLLGPDFCQDVVRLSFPTGVGSGPAGRTLKKPDADDSVIERLTTSLPKLREVDLSFLPITDACLAHLGRERDLERLDLYGTNITDAGLKHLARLQRLEHLDVGGTKVTVAGLVRELGTLRLKGLSLSKDQIRNAVGGEELERKMPGINICEVHASAGGSFSSHWHGGSAFKPRRAKEQGRAAPYVRP